MTMYIWDYKIKDAKKLPEVWVLERTINYGLKENEKIDEKMLRRNWDKIKIDDEKRKFLKLLLWPKKY